MPPKEIQTGTLYFSAGGEFKPLAHITELTEVPEMVAQPDNDVDGFVTEDMVFEGSFTMAWPVSISEKLLILTGKYPSNNWLRMHGYPMRRKRKGTRKKKNYERVHKNRNSLQQGHGRNQEAGQR